MRLSHLDAQGTDGSDLSKIISYYELGGKLVGIPSDTPEAEIEAALVSASGLSENTAEVRRALLHESDAEVLELFVDEVLPYLLQRGFRVSEKLDALIVRRRSIKDRYPDTEGSS